MTPLAPLHCSRKPKAESRRPSPSSQPCSRKPEAGSRKPSRRLPALLLLLALVAPAAALADQEEPAEGEVPESTHPASDSPEAATAARARAPGEPRVKRRVQAFLIPLDERARVATGRVAQGVEAVLAQTRAYDVVDLGKALAMDSTREELTHADEGRRLVAEAKPALAASRYAEAVQKLRAGVLQLQKGLPALDAHELAEAYVRLGVAQDLSGDVKGSRESFAQAAVLDPQAKVDAHAVDPAAEQPMAAARADLEVAPSAVLEIEPRPAGARVLVDGRMQGPAPLRLELATGRHLVRIERAGFYPSAELVEIGSKRETVHAPTLQATPGAATLNAIIAGAADEAGRGTVGASTRKLAERFSLERALVGSVASHGARVAVLLALVDGPGSRMLARQNLMLAADGTDADQLEAETQTAVKKLLAQDDDGAPAGGAPASEGAPAAQGDSGRRAVMPGTAGTAPAPEDDPGLASRERRAALPVASSSVVPEPVEAPARPADDGRKTDDGKKQKKKEKKGIFGKTGTEKWDEADE